MNIPIFTPKKQAMPKLLDRFCHENEMENLSSHLYVEYMGQSNHGADAITIRPIRGISPKVFMLLMLAHAELCFRPAKINKKDAIVLEVPVSFGMFYAYSLSPDVWSRPSSGACSLGFTMIFKHLHQVLAPVAITQHPNLQMFDDPSRQQLALGQTLDIEGDFYLLDVFNFVIELLNRLSAIDKRFSKRN